MAMRLFLLYAVVELAVLVATEDEVGQRWMKRLRDHLQPVLVSPSGLREVSTRFTQFDLFSVQRGSLAAEPDAAPLADGDRLGDQIRRRRGMRSVLSREQSRLLDRDPAARIGAATSSKSSPVCQAPCTRT